MGWVKPLNLTRMAITVAAPIPLIYAMSPPCFLLLAGLCCLLGLVTGAWISATSPLLVTLLGLPQLGTAFGRLTAVRGVAALASPPSTSPPDSLQLQLSSSPLQFLSMTGR